MREKDIEEFGDKIDEAFRGSDPKFRNPSAPSVLENAQRRIKIEQRKFPDVVSEEELLQWAIALKATHRIAGRRPQNDYPKVSFDEQMRLTNGNEDVQKLIEGIMKRPISEEQLGLLLATSPGRYDCSTINTPFFQHYNGVTYNDDGSSKIGYIITDPEKSQKFIKAVYSMPIKGFEDDPQVTLLGIHISESNYMYDDRTREIYDKGLATIFMQEANEVKENGRFHAEEMLKELKSLDKGGDIRDIMNHCPAATKAYQDLQKACVEDYRNELEAMSPIKDLNNTQTRSTGRDCR